MSGRKYVGDVGKPLSPSEILNAKKQIPGYVYDAFNECIADATSSGGTGYFTRHYLVSMIVRKAPTGEFFYEDLERSDSRRSYSCSSASRSSSCTAYAKGLGAPPRRGLFLAPPRPNMSRTGPASKRDL